VAPALATDGGALKEMVVALLGRVAGGASIVVTGFAAMQSFSCWKQAEAEFDGKISLGVAAAERGREVIPVYGVNGRLGPVEANAVFEEAVVSKRAANGAGEVAGDRLTCYEELYLGRWEKGDATDKVGEAAQFGSSYFVGIAVELGWER
jgi:hypothetical protein